MTETKFSASQAREAFVRSFGAALIIVLLYFSLEYPGLFAAGCLVSSVVVFLFLFGSLVHSMLYGRKKMILVLRRFHRPEIGAVITSAHRKRLKRKYRLVTLYDAAFPRAGSPARFQAVVWISMPLMLFGASLVPALLAQAFPIVPLFTDNNLVAFAVVQHFLEYYWPVLSVYVLLFNAMLALALTICLAFHQWRIYRRTKLTISNEKDITSVEYSVWSLGSWMTAPAMMGAQSTVVEVKSELWQQAVATFASIAQAIIIDVSDQSESLLWEIKYCTDHHADKTVFIGSGRSIDAESSVLKRLCVSKVLKHGSIRQENRVFANKLRIALDGIKLGKRSRPRNVTQYIVRDALLIPTMYLTIFCSTQMLSSYLLLGDSLLLPRLVGWFVSPESSELMSPETKKVFSMSLRELADHAQAERKRSGTSDKDN